MNAQNVKTSYFIEKKPYEIIYNLESFGTWSQEDFYLSF